MVTIAEIKQKQQELEQMIENYQREEKGICNPQENELYYHEYDGCVNYSYYSNDNSVHFYRFAIGNYFKTKEKAERELDKRKAVQELKELAGGYKWRKGKKNWILSYDCDTFDSAIEEWERIQGAIYFESHEDIRSAIDILGEEKLKLIFDIEG